MPIAYVYAGPVGGTGGDEVPPWAMPEDGEIVRLEVKWGDYINRMAVGTGYGSGRPPMQCMRSPTTPPFDLCSVDPDPGGTHRPAYLTFIAGNADSLWFNARQNVVFGYSWAGPFDESDALRQSSAFDALVAAVHLDSL